MEDNWQPIETAPKQTPILVAGMYDDEPFVLSAFFCTDAIDRWGNMTYTLCSVPPQFGVLFNEEDFDDGSLTITDWMPLPEPPKGALSESC